MLWLVSKFSWSIRHASLAILNVFDKLLLRNDHASWLLHNFILALVVLIPLLACTCWCCLALEEWIMEEDERGFLRKMLHEAEEARLKELEEREQKKNG